MQVKMPAIVYVFMQNVAKMSDFEIIPADTIIKAITIQKFTETDSVNPGWVAMDN